MTPSAGRARHLRVRGVVQGVGFRPFVYRLAHEHRVAGWVLNGEDGVEIHVEGREEALHAFVRDLQGRAPAAARIVEVAVEPVPFAGHAGFTIRASSPPSRPTVHVSPDLPVCEDCVRELLGGPARRAGYPYINCTNCGPRYSILLGLPYDRRRTTMGAWRMCPACEEEYHDPADRRFHAQPTACWACGPAYRLLSDRGAALHGRDAVSAAGRLISSGAVLAVKGIGGYHLACDARNAAAVAQLRDRKFRKEKPFALLARDLDAARRLASLSPAAEDLLTSAARPIVLAPARAVLPGIAPGTDEIGVMLPYAPLHHLLFAAGAPDALVMTSGNRSSEPIAFEDADARARLAGIADAFLAGERAIARRVEDSVVRAGALGPVILRRSRGYAPAVVARLPGGSPVLAAGGDLKNTITLVVDGQAFVSQHIGDLDDYGSARAFDETARDLLEMYAVAMEDVLVAYDAHPQYASTRRAQAWTAARSVAVQHHRAHIASVLAERGAFDARVVGLACDGTGYGEDGAIWGGELFAGSAAGGLARVGHLRQTALAGGDAAARDPVQASAGFLACAGITADLTQAPFRFPARYGQARRLLDARIRTFPTTSVGRLFDAVAALLGFTRPVTFEAQAAIWLEHLARRAADGAPLAFPFDGRELDFRPALAELVDRRGGGEDPGALARAFHLGLARGLARAAEVLCATHGTNTVVLSGGVFQNELLLAEVAARLESARLQVWTNHAVPPNDGGLSLGQAALALAAAARFTQPLPASEHDRPARAS